MRAADADVRLSIPSAAVVGEPFPVLLYRPGRSRLLLFDQVDVVDLFVDGVKMPVIGKTFDRFELDPQASSRGFKPRFADGVANRAGRVEVSVVITLRPVKSAATRGEPSKTIRIAREIDVLTK
ncbi:MAG: hypothetical protein K2X32_00370 [Phycisphaerales bacterium]|nr:hypothetical protein [Phycisphaerales bacterium]